MGLDIITALRTMTEKIKWYVDNKSYVSYEVVQSLTDEQKAQARANIGAVEFITAEDIDEICGQNIQMSNEVKF